MKKNIYLFLALLGIVLPYSQYVPWTVANGFDFGLMVQQMFVNQIAKGIAFDALLVSLVIIIFIIFDNKRRGVKNVWISVAGIFIFGVAFALPMYLYLKETE